MYVCVRACVYMHVCVRVYCLHVCSFVIIVEFVDFILPEPVVFRPNQTEATVNVTILNDRVLEPIVEAFTVGMQVVGDLAGKIDGSGLVLIEVIDDDGKFSAKCVQLLSCIICVCTHTTYLHVPLMFQPFSHFVFLPNNDRLSKELGLPSYIDRRNEVTPLFQYCWWVWNDR